VVKTKKSGFVIDAEKLLLLNTSVVGSDAAGALLVNDEPGGVTITGSEFDRNARGGIYIVGHGGPVKIAHTRSNDNDETGLTLLDADGASIWKSTFIFTHAIGGVWGDGVRNFISSDVDLVESSSSYNDRRVSTRSVVLRPDNLPTRSSGTISSDSTHSEPVACRWTSNPRGSRTRSTRSI